MTWLAERLPGWLSARAVWLVLAVAGAMVAPAETNLPAPAVPEVAVSNALPAWMELGTLGTNAAAWADMADVWRRQPDAEASPVENLTLPIEHYDNGRVRAVLYASKAAVGKGGMIWAWKVVVEMLDLGGAPDGRIEADSCLYDRTARRGYCPDSVALVRTNVTASGIGMYWTMAPQRMQILSNGVMRLHPKPKDPERKKK
ncbi:MAG: hypothetical protein WCI17_00035 [bacterium]